MLVHPRRRRSGLRHTSRPLPPARAKPYQGGPEQCAGRTPGAPIVQVPTTSLPRTEGRAGLWLAERHMGRSLKARILWPAGAALVAVGVVWFVSAIGAENPQPDGVAPPGSAAQEQPGREAIEVTNTTAAGAAMAVTDTTAALPSDAASTRATTGQTTTSTSTSTSTTTAASRLPPRTRHADWDDRLPGTRDGLGATKCHSTFSRHTCSTLLFWDHYHLESGTFRLEGGRVDSFRAE